MNRRQHWIGGLLRLKGIIALFCQNRRQCSLNTFSAEEKAALKTQIEKIRDEIRACGESIWNCDKLLLLCPEVSISGQWGEIARIAINQRWSFGFISNGDVRFAAL